MRLGATNFLFSVSVLNVWINLPTKHSSIRGISLDMYGNVYCCKSLRKKRNDISYFFFNLFYFIHFVNSIVLLQIPFP